MRIFVAGSYEFVRMESFQGRLVALLKGFSIKDPEIVIEPIDTSMLIWDETNGQKPDNTEDGFDTCLEALVSISEKGAVGKARRCLARSGNGTEPVFGVMLSAILEDGTVLSFWNAMSCPEMTGRTVSFCLGVALFWKGVGRYRSVCSERYSVRVSQKDIASALRKRVSESGELFNPYVTYPEDYLGERATLDHYLGMRLFECANDLLIDVEFDRYENSKDAGPTDTVSHMADIRESVRAE